jgi:Putative peptidoglycan binding domain
MHRILSSAVVVLVAALGIALTPAASASAASVSCTGTTFVGNVGVTEVPSVGNDTDNLNCVLGVGNHSNAVAALQRALNACYGAGLKVDSDFGTKTQAAVRHAQTVENISHDGVYGPQTRDHLHWPDLIFGGCFRLSVL